MLDLSGAVTGTSTPLKPETKSSVPEQQPENEAMNESVGTTPSSCETMYRDCSIGLAPACSLWWCPVGWTRAQPHRLQLADLKDWMAAKDIGRDMLKENTRRPPALGVPDLNRYT